MQGGGPRVAFFVCGFVCGTGATSRSALGWGDVIALAHLVNMCTILKIFALLLSARQCKGVLVYCRIWVLRQVKVAYAGLLSNHNRQF